jgi:alkylresorcinol/alkylpyrone synthase
MIHSIPAVDNEKSVRIASIGVAVPSLVIEQGQAAAFLRERYGDRLNRRALQIMEKVFSHPGIRQRHFALADPAALLDEDADRRVERFRHYAVELACKAAREAMEKAGITAEHIKGLAVTTCTGYLCPGLSTYVMEQLGLKRDIPSYDLVGAGCGGALPNLKLCEALLPPDDGGAMLSIAVEICSATFQMGNDASLIVSNALFGDGAAAAVAWRRPSGVRLAGSARTIIPEHREQVRFVHRNGQLHNQLSSRLPALVSGAMAELVQKLLSPHGRSRDDIRHWALHPGGENIISALQNGLRLTDEQTASTRRIMREFGNMSSPTVWFVLKDIMEKGARPGEWGIMAAYGAGFSIYGQLLQF